MIPPLSATGVKRWLPVGWAWLACGVAAWGESARGDVVGQPLAPRSVAAGPTMFAELAPAETGIVTENRYDDPTMWGARYPLFAVGSTGTGVAIGDYDGDGQPVYVVGNVGLNTRYRADPAHPALLFSGSFDDRGPAQLIEGYYEGDRLYPRRARRDLGAAIPSILKRFPQNDAYARATLPEILGHDALAAAQRFAATEFRSGVLLSQPDGTYRFEPLPRLAQIAPIQGLVAGDFDGDGHANIYAAQNSFAPIPSVGRFDGGLSQLLRGDGHGHFTPVPPAESGLVVPGDAKALAVLDLDEDGLAGLSSDPQRPCRDGVSESRIARPAFRANPAAGTGGQCDRDWRAHHGGTRRRVRADQRSLCRFGLL